MTVKELIEELQKQPENAEVIVSADAEGNKFIGLWKVDYSYAEAYSYTYELIDNFEAHEHSLRVVVLWPE